MKTAPKNAPKNNPMKNLFEIEKETKLYLIQGLNLLTKIKDQISSDSCDKSERKVAANYSLRRLSQDNNALTKQVVKELESLFAELA